MRDCDFDMSRMKKWTLDLRKHSRVCMLQFGGLRCTCGGRRCSEMARLALDLIDRGWP